MGCCLFAVLFAGAPRLAFLMWWLLDSQRIMDAYHTFLWPALGLVFLPWTTITYVLVLPGGIQWFDWLWLALAILADLGGYGGSESARRRRYPSDTARRPV